MSATPSLGTGDVTLTQVWPAHRSVPSVCVGVCFWSHWVHAATVEVPDLPSLKCSSHWSLGLYPAPIEVPALLFLISWSALDCSDQTFSSLGLLLIALIKHFHLLVCS
jgi:hypothetical protein